MRESEGIIERVWRISATLQRVEVSVEGSFASIQPGHSILVAEETPGAYLREQWIPVASGDGQLIIERPVERRYSPGQIVNMLGPIGNPLPWSGGGGKRLLLIAHDTSPAPLLMLAQQAINQTCEVALVLAGSSTLYPFEGIPPAVEVISIEREDGWSEHDQVLIWADQIYAVVNDAFWMDYFGGLYHRIGKMKSRVPLNTIYGVFTLPVICGTGVCTACMVRCKTTNRLTCTDGPAFDLSEVLLT